MNCLDVIFFQAELAPEKLALVAQGTVVSYGRLAHGIVSAQRRLAAAGVREGHTDSPPLIGAIELTHGPGCASCPPCAFATCTRFSE